jgi:hypothetical protein
MQITMLPLRTNRLGQLTDAVSNANTAYQQARAMTPGTGVATQDLANMMTQQAAVLQQSEDALSKAWWSTNWPIVAVGLGALGVMGYHLIYKKK